MQLVDRFVEDEGAQGGVQAVAVGREEAGSTLPGLGEVALEKRRVDPLLPPALRPRDKSVPLPRRLHGRRGETALGGVGEGAEHPGHVLQGAMFGAALREGPGRLPLRNPG